MNSIDTTTIPDNGLPLRSGLWLAQVLLAGIYLPTGIAVLFLPAGALSATVPWAAQVPGGVLKLIGALDLAAGLGILLPSLTRTAPRLAVLAGVCSAVFQMFVIFSHAFLGLPGTTLAVNLAVFAISVFVAWGRSEKAPIAPRRQDRRSLAIEVFTSDHAGKPARRCRRCELKKRTSMASANTLGGNSPRRRATITNRRPPIARTCPKRSVNRVSE